MSERKHTIEHHHYEVIVEVKDGVVIDIFLNDEPSATWWQGTVWMPEIEEWCEADESQWAAKADAGSFDIPRNYREAQARKQS
jgi:hypothetical protein